jgi:hypothetical protein
MINIPLALISFTSQYFLSLFPFNSEDLKSKISADAAYACGQQNHIITQKNLNIVIRIIKAHRAYL